MKSCGYSCSSLLDSVLRVGPVQETCPIVQVQQTRPVNLDGCQPVYLDRFGVKCVHLDEFGVSLRPSSQDHQSTSSVSACASCSPSLYKVQF